MKTKTKLLSLAAVLGLAALAVIPNYLGGFVARQAAGFISSHYGLGVSIDRVKGNPFRGYTFENTVLSDGSGPVLTARKLFLRPGLLKTFFGSLSLRWVEMDDVVSTFDHLHLLAERVTGQVYPPLPDFLPKGPIRLTSLGGTLDGSKARGVLEADVAGFPVKGEAKAELGQKTEFKQAHFELAGGSLDFKGQVMPELDMSLDAEHLQLASLGMIMPVLANNAVTGEVTLQARLKGTVTDPAAQGKVTLQNGRAAGVPLTADIPFDFRGGVLSANPFGLNLAGMPLTGGVRVTFGTGPATIQLVANLQGPQSAQALRENWPALPASVTGAVDLLTLQLAGPLAAPDGALRLKADALAWDAARVNNLNFGADMKSGVLTVKGQAMALGAPLMVDGRGLLAPGGNLSLQALWRDVDLGQVDTLFPGIPLGGHVSLHGQLSGPLGSLKGAAALTGAGVTAFGVRINRLSLPLAYEQNHIKVNKGQLALGDGVLALNASINPAGRTLDVKALGTVGFSAFDGFLPGLTGAGQFTASIGGSFDDIKGRGVLTEGTVNWAGLAFQGLNADAAFGTKPLSYEVPFSAQALLTPVGRLDSLSGKVSGDASVFRISDLAAGGAGGKLIGSLQTQKDQLTGAFELSDLDLASFSNAVSPGLLRGTLAGRADLSGPVSNPVLSLGIKAPQLGVGPLAASDVILEASGPLDKVELARAHANVGDGVLSGRGSMDFAGLRSGAFTFTLSPTRLDKALPGLELPFSGAVAATVECKAVEGKMDLQGRAESSALTVAGINLSNVVTSLFFAEGSLRLPDLQAQAYGGTLAAPAVFAFDKNKWGVNAHGQNLALGPLWKDLMPGTGGLTGNLTADFQGGGTLSPFGLQGRGSVDSDGGQLFGYDWVKLITLLHGEKNLTYASAHLPFTVDLSTFTLLEGATVQAREDDGLYHHLMGQGTVAFDGPLNLNLNGRVNTQLANVLVGGAGGALGGAGLAALMGGGKEVLAGGALAGLIGGGAGQWKRDFRDLSFHLGGTYQAPSVSGFKVGPGENGQESGSKTITEKIADAVSGKATGGKGAVDAAKDAAKQAAGKLLGEGLGTLIQKPQSGDSQAGDEGVEQAVGGAVEEGLKNLFKP